MIIYTKSNNGNHFIKSFCFNLLKQKPKTSHFIRTSETNTNKDIILYSESNIKETKEMTVKIIVKGYIPNIIFLITL